MDSDSAMREQGRPSIYLTVYQTFTMLLACFLLAMAGKGGSGLDLERAEPFISAILGLWGVLIVVGAVERNDARLRLRIAGDSLCCLALVWWTGGVESFFLPILCANVLAGSTVFGIQKAMIFVSTAIVALTLMTVCLIAGMSPAGWLGVAAFDVTGRESYLISCLVGQAMALYVLAYLAARLMGRLRSALSINELIVQNIDEGVVATDSHGRMILINREALEILNYPPETRCLGRRPDEVFRRPEDREILEVFGSRAAETVLEWKGAGDRAFPLSVKIREIDTPLSGEKVWVALLRNQTLERRAAEAEARVSVLEELEDMAWGLAHEIRNPLGSIRGCVQEFGRGELSPEQTARLVRVVIRESDRLDRIVSEFMEYCGSTPDRSEPVDLVALVNEVKESLEQRPDAAGIRFLFENQAGAAAVVSGQRELLYRVVLNLGVNAVEASGGRGTVRLSLRGGNPDGCEIEVEDEGTGIVEDVRRRMFNPFFTTKTREGGLGLAIVEKIVRRHGGSIEVESEVGAGSMFRVWLPAPSGWTVKSDQRHVFAGVTR